MTWLHTGSGQQYITPQSDETIRRHSPMVNAEKTKTMVDEMTKNAPISVNNQGEVIEHVGLQQFNYSGVLIKQTAATKET